MSRSGPISPHPNGALLRCRVTPRSSKSRIKGIRNGLLEVALAAPPLEGRANRELIKYLAKRLSIPRSAFQLIHGERGREKTVLVAGMTPGRLRAALEAEDGQNP